MAVEPLELSMAAKLSNKEIAIYCGDSISNNVHQLFPKLESITSKLPTRCKLILEYPEEVEPPTAEIQNELDRSLESYLSSPSLFRGTGNNNGSNDGDSKEEWNSATAGTYETSHSDKPSRYTYMHVASYIVYVYVPFRRPWSLLNSKRIQFNLGSVGDC